MHRFTLLLTVAIVAITALSSFTPTIQAGTLLPTLTMLQTAPLAQAEVPADVTAKPVVRSTWGAIKALYRAETATDQSPEQFTVQKPGVGMLASQAQRDWWRNIGQSNRNYAIIIEAGRYAGQYGYPNCKEWAKMVVNNASQTVATLTQTLPGADGWYFAYSPYLVGMSGGIYSVHPGSVIQMRWRTRTGFTPHTMIVYSVGNGGFWVIEANWIPNKVAYRWISYADFLAGVIIYSTYTVTG